MLQNAEKEQVLQEQNFYLRSTCIYIYIYFMYKIQILLCIYVGHNTLK